MPVPSSATIAKRIRLIAPSGCAADPDAMTRGIARLRAAGCVVEGESVLDRVWLRFAGSDEERARDINALATMDALPDVVLATRGGYGATRLLEHLNYDALRVRLADASLALVGHSDFTAIQLALHARCGLRSFSGPLLADLGAEPEAADTWRHFRQALSADSVSVGWRCKHAATLDVSGPLWGGNLAVLCSLLGTPYFPRIDAGILFVEDVGEPPYRIERLLYQLHLSGVLGRQRALLLGGFSDCRCGPRDNGYDLAAAFAKIESVVGIPVIGGLPHGHVAQLTLPFGAPARLRVEGQAARLDFAGHARQPSSGKNA